GGASGSQEGRHQGDAGRWCHHDLRRTPPREGAGKRERDSRGALLRHLLAHLLASGQHRSEGHPGGNEGRRLARAYSEDASLDVQAHQDRSEVGHGAPGERSLAWAASYERAAVYTTHNSIGTHEELAMKVGEICQRSVVSIGNHLDLVDAAKLMRDKHVGFLVVLKEGDEARRPIGVLTDRDI